MTSTQKKNHQSAWNILKSFLEDKVLDSGCGMYRILIGRKDYGGNKLLRH